MEQRDDQLLKELYNQARPEAGDAPDFEAMMARAKAAEQVPPWRSRAPLWAAAAVAVAALGGLLLFGVPDLGSPGDANGGFAKEAAPTLDAIEGEKVARNGDDSWEELIDWADDLWEEDFPSDFLL